MNKSHFLRTSCALIIGAFLLSGCGVGGGSGSSALNSNEQDVLYAAIDCGNRHSNRILDSRARYLSWADEEAGPTEGQSRVLGVHELYDIEPCISGARDTNLSGELGGALDAYISALEHIAPLNAQAHTYYDQENYKDDAFAQGKELHPQLVSAYETFAAASATLNKQVSTIQREEQRRELEDLKENGEPLVYLVENTLFLGGDYVDLTNVDEPADVSLESITMQVDAISANMEELRNRVEANPNEPQEVLGVSTLSFFLNDANDFEKAAKDLMRARRDNSGENLYELRNEILETFNDMVDTYNRL